ncbi:MAG: phytanoyl-CoA dioxygenase family protein, partial [Pseudomonadota bacterium]
MKRFTAETSDPDAIVQELLHGAGVVAFSGLFSAEQIAEARAIVMRHSDAAQKVTHFQGKAEADGTLNLQRRVWNLLAKGEVFSQMAAHPVLMTVLRRFLGTEFIMGSIAANRILPGGPGQEPHVDYPYWDFHAPETHPVGLNGSFPMNAQVSVILD